MLEKRDQAIGQSRGRLTSEIYTRTNALGNPTGFYLKGSSAHEYVVQMYCLMSVLAELGLLIALMILSDA